jgi:hypothetical protein
MLLRYCFCMTISQANHCTCPACVSIHTCCHTHYVCAGSRGGSPACIKKAKMHGASASQQWIVVSWEISFLWSTEKVKVSEWCCLKNTKNQLVHKESHSFAFQTTLVYNCIADFSNIRFCSSHFTRCPCMCLHWGQEFLIKCIKCLSVCVYICIFQIWKENCCQKQRWLYYALQCICSFAV